MKKRRKRLISFMVVPATVVSLGSTVGVSAMAGDGYTLLVNSDTGNDTSARAEGAVFKTVGGAIEKALSGDTIKLDSDVKETKAFTVKEGMTFDTGEYDLTTVLGWAFASGSVVVTDSIVNDHAVGKSPYTGKVNGTIYAPSGTLDLRGVDLRLKGEPSIFGGSQSAPSTLELLKVSRVLYGDDFEGPDNQIVKNILIENETTAYKAALGVYYDSLTVDNVSVDAKEGWYWDQHNNFQMYTAYGGTLNINESLTTKEYMNASSSLGYTGTTNLADGAAINCFDFQNTGDASIDENVTGGKVHVNGENATLNATVIINHAITTLGTVNLTAHPVECSETGGLSSVNYGTNAVLTIGDLVFLNKGEDTTKNNFRISDNAKTIIGGLTSTESGADIYVTGTSENTVNAGGGNDVQYIGDIVFSTFADSTSTGATFSLNLDSEDDFFTGSVQGTSSQKNIWGKWGWPLNGDETLSQDSVKGMTVTMSDGSVWNMTKDSIVNSLSVDSSNITGETSLTIPSAGTFDMEGEADITCSSLKLESGVTTNIDGLSTISCDEFVNNTTMEFDMEDSKASKHKLIDITGEGEKTLEDFGNVKFADGKDNGYELKVIDNDLYAVKNSVCTYTVPVTAGEDQTLVLNGRVAGIFTITGNKYKGFKLIQNGKYLAYKCGEIVLQDKEYTWDYNGGLYTDVKYSFGNNSKFKKVSCPKTVRYYLDFNGETPDVSVYKVSAKVQRTATEHTYKYLHDGDGKHEAVCIVCDHHENPEKHKYDEETHYCVCGKYDPDQCYVSGVKVNEKKIKKLGYSIFGRKTLYQYTIKPETKHVLVAKVEYSMNGKKCWKRGDEFTSEKQLKEFYIRITDSNGKVTNWIYKDKKVTPIDK